MVARSRSAMSGASCSRSSTLEYVKWNAAPVNAELPPRASFGAVSIMATDAPASCADIVVGRRAAGADHQHIDLSRVPPASCVASRVPFAESAMALDTGAKRGMLAAHRGVLAR